MLPRGYLQYLETFFCCHSWYGRVELLAPTRRSQGCYFTTMHGSSTKQELSGQKMSIVLRLRNPGGGKYNFFASSLIDRAVSITRSCKRDNKTVPSEMNREMANQRTIARPPSEGESPHSPSSTQSPKEAKFSFRGFKSSH